MRGLLPDGVSAIPVRITVGLLAVAAMVLAVVAFRHDDDSGPVSGPAVTPVTARSQSSTTAGRTRPPQRRATVPPAGTLPPAGTVPPGSTGCDPAARIRSWPLTRRLASLLMVGVDPSGTADAEAAAAAGAGGVFVGGNATGLLTSGALARIRAAAPLGLFVSVDDEGGRVQRIDDLAGPLVSPREQAATLSPGEVRALAARRGRALASYGVDFDLAPVVDVSNQPDGSVIGDRSYGNDPARVVRYAGAFATGLRDAGVLPALKHFPGHGSADGDSHEGAVRTPPLADLRNRDLVPFRELIAQGPTAVMLGHLDVPGLTTPGVPASLSSEVVRLLRGEFGFDGLVVTDDLSGMQAITARFGVPEAAVRAVAAGVDMALLAHGDVDAVVSALGDALADGRIDEARVDRAVARTLVAKQIDPCAVTF